MVSATIVGYRSPKAAATVLVSHVHFLKSYQSFSCLQMALRELNVADIPPAHETGRCDEVLKVISKALTDCRCHMKEKVSGMFRNAFHHILMQIQIAATLGSSDDVSKDIASLTTAILSRTKVKATVLIYLRIAFIVSTFTMFRPHLTLFQIGRAHV